MTGRAHNSASDTSKHPEARAMRFVEFPSGETVPALGLGAWKTRVGEPDDTAQLRALRAGIAQGMTLIDTAEM